MIIYGDQIKDGGKSLPNYDICIIGTGAAGITMALEFYKSKKKRVVVLESGIANQWVGKDDKRWNDPLVEPLDEGTINGFIQSVRPSFLTDSRTRCYGGSTNCWGGWIRPLDSYDFQKWPIKRTDLPYADALQLVDLRYFDLFDQPESWIPKIIPHTTQQQSISDIAKLLDSNKLNNAGLRTTVIQQQTSTTIRDFQERFRWIFEDAGSNLTLIRNATALEFGKIDTFFALKGLLCNSWDFGSGKEGLPFQVEATNFVLAMGGLEIPRFMLINREKFKNSSSPFSNPLIGKNYMNHPKVIHFATVGVPLDAPKDANGLNGFYQGRNLEESSSIHVQGYLVPIESRVNPNGPMNWRSAVGFETYPYKDQYYRAKLEINFEHAPSVSSAVTLSQNNTDNLFKQKQLEIDWKFTETDAKTYNSAIAQLKDFFEKQLRGVDFKAVPWDTANQRPPITDLEGDKLYTGDHHIGTTRMSKSPAASEGVVNENCQAYSSANLFVCSTSVFPTGGWANSTLTLLALAIRLARFLDSRAETPKLKVSARTGSKVEEKPKAKSKEKAGQKKKASANSKIRSKK